MFTGLVQDLGRVAASKSSGDGLRITIETRAGLRARAR